MSLVPEVSAATADALVGRTQSIAYRLLCGSGCGALLAYRQEPQISIEFLAHGLTRSGHIVVACCPTPGDEVAEMPLSESIAIRLDVTKASQEPSVHIISSAVHLLGTLEWMPQQVSAQLLADDQLPPRVATTVTHPHGRLGVIRTQRVLLHDSTGVTPLAFGTLMEASTGMPFPIVEEEFEAFDAAMSLGEDALWNIAEAIGDERIEGRICSRHAVTTGCPHTWNRIYCVDVDRYGLTLMLVEPTQTSTFFAPFGAPVDEMEALDKALQELASKAAPGIG
ncbi:hypothetical protein [Propionibacterium australiense]|uniref:Uncharacterized protein n=1 Tax=Propionibacterium australiense TaxID=119981 RepID=A0A383S726_9ACTN|nr:hypothetical protein [Propionibacterium australiense]RLP07049.1 hypothetical protein D7U36_11775 [Propionibacterium australiense]RLP07086.1 hypothetical protein D9T14_10785 [Propionibacterium australiense]SYZ33169.1 Domain of unknown function DUF2470 [Propionibacterium australiense]VEH89185.1 Uncharacterised protein [Propionibacterium australiense]